MKDRLAYLYADIHIQIMMLLKDCSFQWRFLITFSHRMLVAFYVSNDKFYILIDETLYSVDLVSKEVMTEITGLKENSYAIRCRRCHSI
ncbi:MAG: hypothetical protein ACLRMX_11085 [Lachnospira eligens]